MKNTFLILTLVLAFASIILSQEVSKSEDKKSSNVISAADGVEAPQAVEGDVIFSDGTNNLLRITDEGTTGAIQFQDGAPSDVTNKLYNNSGILHFNGTALGSGGATSLNELSDAIYDGSSIFIGEGSGINDGSNNNNTAIGFNALNLNTTGTENTAIGYNTLKLNATGTYNTAVGYSALTSNTDSYNTAIGYYSLYSNTTGAENTAIGSEALRDNTTGSQNIAIGETPLLNNESGNKNIAIGNSALSNNITGKNNTAIGYNAGDKAEGDGNVFLGYSAGSNETGSNKLFIESGFDDINNPLIWGDFSLDSVKINGFAHVTKAFSVGSGAKSLALNSVAFGKNTSVLGITSIAAGEDNTVFSYNSSTFGLGLRSSSYLSTVIGRFNENDLLFDQENWVATEPLFVIGNGTDDANRANAFTVKKNGNTTINGNLDVNGRAAIGETANASGVNSFAIGSNVNASGNGTIFIGDNSATTVQNAGNDNRFAARFENGYRFYTATDLSTGALMNSGDNSWSSISDSTKKEKFLKVDGEGVLSKISKFNLRSWNYKGQDPTKFRHYGPMAQEFYAAFGNDGIGTIGNDTTIASADFDGINLIAIQALEKRTKQQNDGILNLELRVKELESQNKLLVAINEEFRINNQELAKEIKLIKNVITTISNNNQIIKMVSKD